MEAVLRQLLRDSFTLLRRPTLKTFGAIKTKDWRLGILYAAAGSVVVTLLTMLSNTLQASRRADLSAQLTQRLGPNQLATLLNAVQNPVLVLGLGLAGFFTGLLLWMLVPYGLGRAFGGTRSFGSFVYRSALFSTPLRVLDSLLGLTIGGVASGIVLIVSLSLDVFASYLLYLNVRATLKLSGLKSALIGLIPILLALFMICGVLLYFLVAVLRR
jgi:hypothetical protein